MDDLQSKVLAEIARGPTLFTEHRDVAEWRAARQLERSGLVSCVRAYSACESFTITDAGRRLMTAYGVE